MYHNGRCLEQSQHFVMSGTHNAKNRGRPLLLTIYYLLFPLHAPCGILFLVPEAVGGIGCAFYVPKASADVAKMAVELFDFQHLISSEFKVDGF